MPMSTTASFSMFVVVIFMYKEHIFLIGLGDVVINKLLSLGTPSHF